MNEPIIPVLNINNPCPKCGKMPVQRSEASEVQALQLYFNSKTQKFSMRCCHCNTMLDMNMPPENVEILKQALGDQLKRIN